MKGWMDGRMDGRGRGKWVPGFIARTLEKSLSLSRIHQDFLSEELPSRALKELPNSAHSCFSVHCRKDERVANKTKVNQLEERVVPYLFLIADVQPMSRQDAHHHLELTLFRTQQSAGHGARNPSIIYLAYCCPLTADQASLEFTKIELSKLDASE